MELSLHSKTLRHMDDLIAVRWEAPGSRYDGIEHWVSRSLVDNVGGGKVGVVATQGQGKTLERLPGEAGRTRR